jgi:protein-arginine kinase activator protein McsA
VETPVKKTNIEDNNNVTQPKTNYEKFSLQELEDMKKKAVSEKDYSKAAEIKEEINKRNQK